MIANETMGVLVASLPLIIPTVLIAIAMIKDGVDKERIRSEYEVLVWDEEDYFYVVRDRKTKKQYKLESTFFGYKFKEESLDWSDTRYTKEHIPGTRKYETTINGKYKGVR